MSGSGRQRSFSRAPGSSHGSGDAHWPIRRASEGVEQHGSPVQGDVPGFPSPSIYEAMPFGGRSPSLNRPTAWRRPSSSSAMSRRPSSSSASHGPYSGHLSNDSSFSAHTAAQSPSSSPSTPRSKSGAFSSRSKILASTSAALDSSPPPLPVSPSPWAGRNANPGADSALARSVSPLPAGKSSILMNTSGSASIMERKRRLASASGSSAFDDGMTDSSSLSGISTRATRLASDQASVLSSASSPSVARLAHKRNLLDVPPSPSEDPLPSSIDRSTDVNEGHLSFKERLFGPKKEKRNASASKDDDAASVMSNVSRGDISTPLARHDAFPERARPSMNSKSKGHGHNKRPSTAGASMQSRGSAGSRPSTADARSHDGSFGTPGQRQSTGLPRKLNSSTSIARDASDSHPDLSGASSPSRTADTSGASRDSAATARKLGSPAALYSETFAVSPQSTSRSHSALRPVQSYPSDSSPSHTPTDHYPSDSLPRERFPRRRRTNSRGSASIHSVASYTSHISTNSVPTRGSSLKSGGRAPPSPVVRPITSPSSSYKSTPTSPEHASTSNDIHSSSSGNILSARGTSARSSWRQSSSLATAAGSSGAVALATIRASFGEPSKADRNGKQSDVAPLMSLAALRIVETDSLPTITTPEEGRQASMSKLMGDELEWQSSVQDHSRTVSPLGQPLRPTKSPLRSRNAPSVSESGHGARSISAPIAAGNKHHPDGQRVPPHLQQLSPPRKSLEEMGIVDAVYASDSLSTSGSFPRLAPSFSQTSLRAQEIPPVLPAKPTSLAGTASASTLSLMTDEETEGGHGKPATSKPNSKRYNTLRKVTPPAIAMAFSKSQHKPSGLSVAEEPHDDSVDPLDEPGNLNGQRKKSIWRLNLGKDDHLSISNETAMPTTKSKVSMSIRGRKSEPQVSRPTIRRIYDTPSGNASSSNIGGGNPADSTLGDSSSTSGHDRSFTAMQSASSHSLPRDEAGLDSPASVSVGGPGTPQTPSEDVPAHLKKLVRRCNAIRELVETERNYASDLVVVRDIYLARAKALAGISVVSPLQTPLSGQTTPSLSPAIVGTPTSAPPHASNYMTVKGTPPSLRSRTVSHKASTEMPLASPAALPSSNASLTGTSSGPSNRSSTYTTSSHTSSDLSFHWPPNGSSLPGTPPVGQVNSVHKGNGIPSGSPAPSLQQHKGTIAKIQTSGSGTPSALLGEGPLSVSDIRLVFAHLESCCSLAHDMTSVLQAAMGSLARERGLSTGKTTSDLDTNDDRMGQAFLTLMQRIEGVYMAYCSRHEASMQRLQVLITTSPKAASFLKECTEIARRHTTAWDLGSLLIKPVQRVLKYPLLLRQILSMTDIGHPDHSHLIDALGQIQSVADKINQVKRRRDLVDTIIAGRDREAKGMASSPLSTTQAKSKKKSGSLPRASNMTGEILLDDAALDHALKDYGDVLRRFEALHSRVAMFGRQCGAWSHALRESYYAQLQIMRRLRRIYGLRILDDEAGSSLARPAPAGPEDAIVSAYMDVLKTIINRSWRQMDSEIRTAILPMTTKVENMFDAPRSVIGKRDEREGDYARCRGLLRQAGGSSKGLDRKTLESANGFVALQAQLIDEVPVFLQGVQVLLDVGVQAFARLQAAHLDEVRILTLEFWTEKAGHAEEVGMVGVDDEDLLNVGPTLRHINPVRAFWESHRAFSQWSDSLAIARRESDVSVMATVGIDDVSDSELNDPIPKAASSAMLASMPSSSAAEGMGIFTSPFEQKAGSSGKKAASSASSTGHSSGPAFLPVPGGRRPSGGVAGLMRTISGTFSRENTPSPGAENVPPLPNDAVSTVRLHRSPVGESGQPEVVPTSATMTISALPPSLPSLVFREDGSQGGVFIQNSPIAFLDTADNVNNKEPYGASPSVQPADERQQQELPKSGDLGRLPPPADGESTRSNSFVSAESERSRLLRNGSVDMGSGMQTTTDSSGNLSVPQSTSSTQNPQRHKMKALYQCVATLDSTHDEHTSDDQHLDWPFVRYVRGDTFRVLSKDGKTIPGQTLLFGRLDRTGEMGWVEKAHFEGEDCDG